METRETAILVAENLIDAHEVAEILGLSGPRAVSVYSARYVDMPKPVIDRGEKRAKLWWRPDVIAWRASRNAH